MALIGKHVDKEDLQTVIDQLASEKEIVVTVSDPNKVPGGEKASGVGRPAATPPAGDLPGGKKQPEQGKVRQESLTQAQTYEKEDGTLVTYVFHGMITPVDATTATLRIQLMFITGIMVILSVLLAFLMARHVSRPMEDMNKSAKNLAKGDYGTRFCETDFLEIRELSDTLNEAAKELSKVEGFRRELLANIAHDLRTPLSLIYSYAEMMHDFPGEIRPEQTQVIMEETSRLSSLVNDVFEVSKLETGTQVLSCSSYPLTEQIAEIIRRMEALLRKEEISIVFEYQEAVYVEADSVKIGQVFYNLLQNAINYVGKDKQILVRQSLVNNQVKIEVIDHGDGIREEDTPYIWDRYYKVQKVHRRAVHGTGLGLCIVKKIMEMHGGGYGVESEPGAGSDFWFTLPHCGL